jgi:hypothetical protein
MRLAFQFDLSDEEWGVLADALKRNTTIETLHLSADFLNFPDEPVLSVSAALSLANAILVHPKLKELRFFRFSFNEFNAITLAIVQNEKLKCLDLSACVVTPRLTENLRFLLTANALETLRLHDNGDENDDRVEIDLGCALGHNRSLKELSITNETDEEAAMTASTIAGIARLLSINQSLQELDLSLPEIENCSDLIAQVARSAKGHA